MANSDFLNVKPWLQSNVQPQFELGNLTETMFKAQQLSLQRQEQQRRSTQGLLDTFLTLAKLNQERINAEMDNMSAVATLEELQRSHAVAEQEKAARLQLDRERLGLEREQLNRPSSFTPIDPKTGEALKSVLGPPGSKFDFIPTEPRDPLEKKSSELIQSAKDAYLQISGLFNNFADTAYGRIEGTKQAAYGMAGHNPRYRSLEGARGLFTSYAIKTIGRDAANVAVAERKMVEAALPMFTDTPEERMDKLEVFRDLAAMTEFAHTMGKSLTVDEISKIVENKLGPLKTGSKVVFPSDTGSTDKSSRYKKLFGE